MAMKFKFGTTLAPALLLLIGATANASLPPQFSDNPRHTIIAGQEWDLTTYINPTDSMAWEEREAASFYTYRGYYEINRALREGNASMIKRYAKKILNLASFVNKRRDKKCTFYRFIDGNPALLDQMKTRGQIFVERGFFSTTLDRHPDDDGLFSRKEYVITGTSSRCADISDVARFQGENEVLFPPGTEFVVTKSMNGKNIYLREK